MYANKLEMLKQALNDTMGLCRKEKNRQCVLNAAYILAHLSKYTHPGVSMALVCGGVSPNTAEIIEGWVSDHLDNNVLQDLLAEYNEQHTEDRLVVNLIFSLLARLGLPNEHH